MYEWLKLIHIVAAIVAVGTNVTYFVWLRRVRGGAAEGAFVLDGIQALDRRLANPAYVVLPVTGIVMVLISEWRFTTFWIAAAIVLYIVMGAFAGIFFAPALRRQTELAQAGEAATADYAAAVRRTVSTGVATMVLIGVIVALMVLKPG